MGLHLRCNRAAEGVQGRDAIEVQKEDTTELQ